MKIIAINERNLSQHAEDLERYLTSVAFGLSHLTYGWNMRAIVLGVVPCGLLSGMSAIATRGLAVPIGLHTA